MEQQCPHGSLLFRPVRKGQAKGAVVIVFLRPSLSQQLWFVVVTEMFSFKASISFCAKRTPEVLLSYSRVCRKGQPGRDGKEAEEDAAVLANIPLFSSSHLPPPPNPPTDACEL